MSVPTSGLAGRRAVLLGLGARTNVALARYLARQGARVTLSDAKPAEQLGRELELVADLPVALALGGHPASLLDEADVVFVTPGVPREIPFLRAAAERGIPISSEIELLFEVCPAPIVGITGSAGKTTTTTLVGEMLRRGGRTVHVGGNIGAPLIDRVEAMSSGDWVVLELSSFQLEPLARSPRVAAVLNVTPNHLDRHGTLERYADAKVNILRFQRLGDIGVLGADDPVARGMASVGSGRKLYFGLGALPGEGATLDGDRLRLVLGDRDDVICRLGELRLRGQHNTLNILAASCIAAASGVAAPALAEAARSFGGVEHRIETVRVLDDVEYVNDSIATAPERTIAALRALEKPLVWIAGGRSKHLPLEEMARLGTRRARAVVLIGEMADELEEALRAAPAGDRLQLARAGSMPEAVAAARALARPGDAVLLSPAGTSFDWYRDFEERGRAFKEAVLALERGR